MNTETHDLRLQYLETLVKFPEMEIDKALEIADGYISGTRKPTTDNPDLSHVTSQLGDSRRIAEADKAATAVKPKFTKLMKDADKAAQAMRDNEAIAEEIQAQPSGPVRYEDMINTQDLHQPPRESNIKISRPLNEGRDSRGISETGGAITKG
jgi:hypothetical protein